MKAYDPVKLAWEARAKIMWGEPVSGVKDWLTNNGMSSQETADVLTECMEERDAEFRKRGILEIIIGLALIVGSLGVVVAMLITRVISGTAWALSLLASSYGLYRLGRGICWMIRGGRSDGSLSKHD